MSGVAFESWCRAHAHPDASSGPPSPSATSLTRVGQLLALGQQPTPKKSNNEKNAAVPLGVKLSHQRADQFAPAGSEPPVSQIITTATSRPSPPFVPPATAEDVIVAAVRRAQNFNRAQLDAFGDALSPHRWVAVDRLSEEAEVRRSWVCAVFLFPASFIFSRLVYT